MTKITIDLDKIAKTMVNTGEETPGTYCGHTALDEWSGTVLDTLESEHNFETLLRAKVEKLLQ
jgi:hypothetical protein